MMQELNISMFVRKEDRDALESAQIASLIRSNSVSTSLQNNLSGHWTLTVKPENVK